MRALTLPARAKPLIVLLVALAAASIVILARHAGALTNSACDRRAGRERLCCGRNHRCSAFRLRLRPPVRHLGVRTDSSRVQRASRRADPRSFQLRREFHQGRVREPASRGSDVPAIGCIAGDRLGLLRRRRGGGTWLCGAYFFIRSTRTPTSDRRSGRRPSTREWRRSPRWAPSPNRCGPSRRYSRRFQFQPRSGSFNGCGSFFVPSATTCITSASRGISPASTAGPTLCSICFSDLWRAATKRGEPRGIRPEPPLGCRFRPRPRPPWRARRACGRWGRAGPCAGGWISASPRRARRPGYRPAPSRASSGSGA